MPTALRAFLEQYLEETVSYFPSLGKATCSLQLAQPCLHCRRFQVRGAALDPVIALAEVDAEGEQQIVNSIKINGNFCFTLIKLPFLKSKSFSPNQHML